MNSEAAEHEGKTNSRSRLVSKRKIGCDAKRKREREREMSASIDPVRVRRIRNDRDRALAGGRSGVVHKSPIKWDARCALKNWARLKDK